MRLVVRWLAVAEASSLIRGLERCQTDRWQSGLGRVSTSLHCWRCLALVHDHPVCVSCGRWSVHDFGWDGHEQVAGWIVVLNTVVVVLCISCAGVVEDLNVIGVVGGAVVEVVKSVEWFVVGFLWLWLCGWGCYVLVLGVILCNCDWGFLWIWCWWVG